jgi:hypothetical protein
MKGLKVQRDSIYKTISSTTNKNESKLKQKTTCFWFSWWKLFNPFYTDFGLIEPWLLPITQVKIMKSKVFANQIKKRQNNNHHGEIV